MKRHDMMHHGFMEVGRLFYAAVLLVATTVFADQVAGGGSEKHGVGLPVPKPADPALAGSKYLDPKAPVEERVNDLFSKLTPEEKAALIHGCSGMGYGAIPRIGLPEILMTDGPQGVRLDKGSATAMPCGLAMAATWNPELAGRVGAVFGDECRALNRRVFLAPGVNIMRTPLGGRNFEYMGEDPVLAGRIAAACVRGVQSQGVAACVKHWNGNEQEHWRTTINVEMDERALREIYAPAFEIAVREGGAWSIMPSYNRFRGDYACASRHLNREILRGQFGFDGALVSDWGAWHDDKSCIEGGCTIEMPSGKNPGRDRKIAERVARGEINQADFDDAVRRNLRLLFRVGAFDEWKPGTLNTPEHQRTAREAAAEAVVLLKNDGALLPFDPVGVRTIAVIGPNADQFQTMADGSNLHVRGGSGATRPPYEVTPLAALRQRFGDKVRYAPGIVFKPGPGNTIATVADPAAMDAAVGLAKSADIVLFFGGTHHGYDREAIGWGDVPNSDKPDLELPGPQAELIKRIAAANPKTVVVLVNGAPVSVEQWHDKIPAIVEAWYGGMEAGNAIIDILTGVVNPSGKLPCTFGRKLEDWPCHALGKESFPGTGNNGVVKYLDSIWVGYRAFDRDGTEPRFPFGFGLSYTTFKTGKPKLSASRLAAGASIVVTATVKNTGRRAGAEVVQLYVAPCKPSVPRPPKELKGFQKVFLQPGEIKTLEFTVTPRDLSFWDAAANGWKAEPGSFEIQIGNSSRHITGKAGFVLE